MLAAPRNRLVACAALGLLSVLPAVRAEPLVPGPVDAQFRGCEAEGWCRFRIEALDPHAEVLHRVRPDGISRTPGNDIAAMALRDRLNVLLAGMIHQHKRIELHDLRRLDDGTFAARLTVNGVALASDPILVEFLEQRSGGTW